MLENWHTYVYVPSSLIMTVSTLNNVIDIASRSWTGESGSIQTDKFWFTASRLALGLHQMGTGPFYFFFRTLVLPGFETGYSFLSSTEINVWSCTFTPPYVFMVWWLIKHMEHVSSVYVATLPNALDLLRSVCLMRHKGDPSSRYPSLWTTRLSVDRNQQ